MLFLVATPIGNLGDFSQRAVDTLNACDYILCEDTRHSLPLLTHFGIKKPLKSFHKFNESLKEETVIHDLLQGSNISLISDAGTPGIADPGSKLVQRCVEEGIQVVAIPGPCAAVVGLVCSGFDTTRFQFLGFLPRKLGELKHLLQEILSYPGTTICYESPFRLSEVLTVLCELAPERQLAIGRELTKKFEEIKRGKPSELLEYWSSRSQKGEIVLLISGQSERVDKDWEKLTPMEHVELLEKTYKLSKRDAIKMAAELRGVPKREIYNESVKDI